MYVGGVQLQYELTQFKVLTTNQPPLSLRCSISCQIAKWRTVHEINSVPLPLVIVMNDDCRQREREEVQIVFCIN